MLKKYGTRTQVGKIEEVEVARWNPIFLIYEYEVVEKSLGQVMSQLGRPRFFPIREPLMKYLCDLDAKQSEYKNAEDQFSQEVGMNQLTQQENSTEKNKSTRKKKN